MDLTYGQRNIKLPREHRPRVGKGLYPASHEWQAMKECETCGESLIDGLDIVLFILGPVQFVFGLWILISGSILGLASIAVSILATIGLVARKRVCSTCSPGPKGESGGKSA
jgi:hypothetical protein